MKGDSWRSSWRNSWQISSQVFPFLELSRDYYYACNIDVSIDDVWRTLSQEPLTGFETLDPEKQDLIDVRTQSPVEDSDSIPDGGLTAWLQVLGSFFLFINSWGIINSFGAFQTNYETDLLASSDGSAIAWIGSIQTFLALVVGSLTGPIYDAGYFRTLVMVGTVLITLGMMMLSLCTEFYQVMLAQGICVGLGCGCLFVPSVAILSTYFTTKIAIAVGIAASGSSIGGVIYPILWYKLQPMVGFGWATRIFAFTVLTTLLVPMAVMKVRVLPAKKRGLFDVTAFKIWPYNVYIIGTFIAFMGIYAPLYFVQLYDIQKKISPPELVFYLLPIINAASTFGRTIPNILADKVGPLNVMIPCSLISGILGLCLIAVDSFPAMIAFCILYGFFSGTFVSLPAPVIVSLCPDRSVIGTRMGMVFSITSLGLLIGNPIAGAIQTTSGFANVWVYSGLLAIVGGGIVFIARSLKTNWVLVAKC